MWSEKLIPTKFHPKKTMESLQASKLLYPFRGRDAQAHQSNPDRWRSGQRVGPTPSVIR